MILHKIKFYKKLKHQGQIEKVKVIPVTSTWRLKIVSTGSIFKMLNKKIKMLNKKILQQYI